MGNEFAALRRRATAAALAFSLLAAPWGSIAYAGKSILYSFRGGSDGAQPQAGLTYSDGALYGTTDMGGTRNQGTVYKLTLDGTEAVLHSFGGPGDGSRVQGGLVNVRGTLYGVTVRGGPHHAGTVFKIARNGTESVLYSFQPYVNHDAWHPQRSLINVGGILYGATTQGGAYDYGSVFAVTLDGRETVLHSFDGHEDGASPGMTLLNVAGVLFGTVFFNPIRSNSLGIVFRLTRSGQERILYGFKGNGDGALPGAGLISVAGMLYGTTQNGGINCPDFGGCGTVFMMTPQGIETVLYSFGGQAGDGYFPTGNLLEINGTFYGLTGRGGAYGSGTVYAVKPPAVAGKPWTEKVLYSFKGGVDGYWPVGDLINLGGTLCGATSGGGASDNGTVFALTP